MGPRRDWGGRDGGRRLPTTTVHTVVFGATPVKTYHDDSIPTEEPRGTTPTDLSPRGPRDTFGPDERKNSSVPDAGELPPFSVNLSSQCPRMTLDVGSYVPDPVSEGPKWVPDRDRDMGQPDPVGVLGTGVRDRPCTTRPFYPGWRRRRRRRGNERTAGGPGTPEVCRRDEGPWV